MELFFTLIDYLFDNSWIIFTLSYYGFEMKKTDKVEGLSESSYTFKLKNTADKIVFNLLFYSMEIFFEDIIVWVDTFAFVFDKVIN